MTFDPCLPPLFSNLQSYPSPQPVCIYSYAVSMTTVTFHPLPRPLHLLSIKWTRTFSPLQSFIHKANTVHASCLL